MYYENLVFWVFLNLLEEWQMNDLDKFWLIIGVVRRLICWYKSVDNMDFNNIKQPVVTIGHVSPADLIDCLLVFFFLLKN